MEVLALSPLVVAGVTLSMPLATQADPFFDLEASFLVCLNSDCDEETSSEIITATADGMTLIYSDSPFETVGFIGIADPANPVGLGSVPLSGEPTSVATVVGVDKEYLLVTVNTSPSFDENFNNDHSGELQVFDIAGCLADVVNCASVATLDLGGQPDSVAVSPDGTFAAIAIENERDEEACHTTAGVLVPAFYDDEDGCLNADPDNRFGEIPQPGAGFLAVIDDLNTTAPGTWDVDRISLTGLTGLYESSDPEPEYVHINADNKAVVSLQENNAFVIVDLPTLMVDDSYSAGAVDLVNIDTEENDLIELKDDQPGRRREPDGVFWIGTSQFASANEGDLFGGSRGFTIFNSNGTVDFESFESYDYLQVMYGHYPEDRSENKGSEPEAVTYANFGDLELLFVASERSNTVAVYDFADKNGTWKPMQYLPAVMGPESVLAITDRDDGKQVVAVANEVDDEARSMVNIYVLKDLLAPAYPTVASVVDATPPRCRRVGRGQSRIRPSDPLGSAVRPDGGWRA